MEERPNADDATPEGAPVGPNESEPGPEFDDIVDELIDPFLDERSVDGRSASELFEELYDVLREIAARRMAGQRSNHTLQATALVHDAYMRLAKEKSRWNSRGHFLCAVALTMRRLLLDHEQRRRAKKRTRPDDGPLEDEQVVLFDVDALGSAHDFDTLLRELHDRGDDWGWRFLLLRFYADATIDEISDVLETPKRTTERRWTALNAWVRGRYEGGGGAGGAAAPHTPGGDPARGGAAANTTPD